MAPSIEDYGLIGNGHTCALVARGGSIDWFCAPRFDSGAWFTALLGTADHGRWLVAPEGALRHTRRAYRPGTLVLDTVHELDGGAVRITDALVWRDGSSHLVRVAACTGGTVRLRLELNPRYEYGRVGPRVRAAPGGAVFTAAPSSLRLRAERPLAVEGSVVRASTELRAGEEAAWVLTEHAAHEAPPAPLDARAALHEAEASWRAWSERMSYRGPWREAVVRSMLTIRGLTWAPSGAMVAAATTSLPEQLGGTRNWDYRYTWLRDATFTFYAFLSCGLLDEARAWRDWLVRAAGGDPGHLQVLFGLAGERHQAEWVARWLPGYQGAGPVRIGNDAYAQLQHDVVGEVIDCLHASRGAPLGHREEGWPLERALADQVARSWREPDDGIWEMRSRRRAFTTSRVMSWVALDRAVRDAEALGVDAPLDRWRAARDAVHDEVCRRGFDRDRGAFTLDFGSSALDASTLLIPLVGFLPARDPRVASTIEAIRRELTRDGLVLRYRTGEVDDDLPPGEGAFLPCSLWLADALALQGRREEAVALFERVLSLANDLGLLSEEYDVDARRLTGNFPQVLTHIALVNTAFNLSAAGGAAHQRSRR